MVVRQCQRCQLAKSLRSIKSDIEEMKSIRVCDLFYRVALDIAGPLPETKNGNRYTLVAINHYSKWCEARPVKDHDAAIAARFLEEEIICKFGVLDTDNGGEWMVEFDPQWPQCNGMVERMIKTLKNGLSLVSFTDLDNWDLQLPQILFGYKCGVQASTKFSPFMVLIGRTPRLTCDNGLSTFTNVQKDEFTLDEMTQLMVEKFKLIFYMHSFVLENVDQAQKRQCRSYATQKNKQEFSGLEEGRTMVKLRKPRKKRALLVNWECPYTFVKYKDEKGCREFDDGCRVYILQGNDGKRWERARRDLQVFQ
jgi:hypothetical protein